MTRVEPARPQHRTIVCRRCDRPMLVRESWRGREVRCPHCGSVVSVPDELQADGVVRAGPPDLRVRHAFNFACPRCGCLLEAHTGMSGKVGRCPTCVARFVVPACVDQYPEPAKLLDDEPSELTALHAYAGSGDHAPQIRRSDDGNAAIVCPRCGSESAIDADKCGECGAPFTFDAVPSERRLQRDRYAIIAFVLGLISLPLFSLLLPGIAAVLMAGRSFRQTAGLRPGWMSLVGGACGGLSIVAGLYFWFF